MTAVETLLRESEAGLIQSVQNSLRSIAAVHSQSCPVDLVFSADSERKLCLSLDSDDLQGVVEACEANVSRLLQLTSQLQKESETVVALSTPTSSNAACCVPLRLHQLENEVSELEKAHAARVERDAADASQRQRELADAQQRFDAVGTAYAAVQEAVMAAARECAQAIRHLHPPRSAVSGNAEETPPLSSAVLTARCAALTQQLWDAYHSHTGMPAAELSGVAVEGERCSQGGCFRSLPFSEDQRNTGSLHATVSTLQHRAEKLLDEELRRLDDFERQTARGRAQGCTPEKLVHDGLSTANGGSSPHRAFASREDVNPSPANADPSLKHSGAETFFSSTFSSATTRPSGGHREATVLNAGKGTSRHERSRADASSIQREKCTNCPLSPAPESSLDFTKGSGICGHPPRAAADACGSLNFTASQALPTVRARLDALHHRLGQSVSLCCNLVPTGHSCGSRHTDVASAQADQPRRESFPRGAAAPTVKHSGSSLTPSLSSCGDDGVEVCRDAYLEFEESSTTEVQCATDGGGASRSGLRGGSPQHALDVGRVELDQVCAAESARRVNIRRQLRRIPSLDTSARNVDSLSLRHMRHQIKASLEHLLTRTERSSCAADMGPAQPTLGML